MNARLMPDGTLLVPARADGPEGEIGDGMVVCEPDDPRYESWLAEAVRPGETPLEALERRLGVRAAP